jgi:7-cyano-7-deazaguanine synthase
MKKVAIVLCSGGLDSVTTAHYVSEKLGYDNLIFLFFNYGQKSLTAERTCAKLCAKKLEGKFDEVKLDWLGKISGSLINKKGVVKKLSMKDLKDTKKESEKYYVPCRNTIFLTHALALAESIFVKSNKESDIFVGFKCEGNESYPDTTKEFVKEMSKLGKIGCSGNFEIKAPLISKDKEDIVLLGKKLGVDFRETFSCYVGKKKHCGECLACRLRQAGFHWAGVEDETNYLKC